MKKFQIPLYILLMVVLLSACGKTAPPDRTESPEAGLEKLDESKAISIEKLPEKMRAAGEIALALSSAECEELVGKTSLDAEEACRFYFAVWGASDSPQAEDALENTYAEDVEELTNRMLGLTEERDYSVIAIELKEADAPFCFYYKEDGRIGKANATDGMDVMITGYGGNEDENSQPYTISVSAAYPANPEEIAYITTWEFKNVDGEIRILSATKTGDSQDESDAESMKTNTAASESFDGKYRIEAYGVDDTITYGGMYPAEGIRLVAIDTGKELWSMTPGYYVANFIWSKDSRFVSVYYEARIYGSALVVDTSDMSETELPDMPELQEKFPNEADPKKDRPDPYIVPREWVNDHVIRVDFEWVQQDESSFKGYYDYDNETKQITGIKREE